MKEELKKIILHKIETIESQKKGKIDPSHALFSEVWHSVFMDLKESISGLISDNKIELINTINQDGYKIKNYEKIN